MHECSQIVPRWLDMSLIAGKLRVAIQWTRAYFGADFWATFQDTIQ